MTFKNRQKIETLVKLNSYSILFTRTDDVTSLENFSNDHSDNSIITSLKLNS